MAKELILLTSLLILTAYLSSLSQPLPLSTNSRWIVDEPTGKRVKLACGNLVGHTEPMLPEGLNKQPLSEIARNIRLMGFNCVRLTYAAFMYTRYSDLTVVQRFQDLRLHEAIQGIANYNPQFLGLTLLDAQKNVIDDLGSHGIMVILDNHVSQPMWCCAKNDGNGFWGDKYFDPNEWLLSQTLVARRYKNNPMVVAMSLRNELHGPLQNESAWYRYVEEGARTIHKENPNVLVLISGLRHDSVFTYLKKKPLNLSFKNKLVYEYHRYAFSDGQSREWSTQPVNKMCDFVTQDIEHNAGFLFKGNNPSPLFLTEWGIDQYGDNQADNMFLGCILLYMAENDLDWALWALQGSYYFRHNLQDPEERYGMFNATWTGLKSSEFHSELLFIQSKIQDPNAKMSYLVMYHPFTSKCLRANEKEILASECFYTSQWSHDAEGTPIRLVGTDLCVAAAGDGLPATLSTDCLSEESSWRQYSRYQIANRRDLCLELDPNYSIPKLLTKKCIESDDHVKNPENPQTQWVNLIRTGLPVLIG